MTPSAGTLSFILWTVAARRHLRQALAAAVCRDPNAVAITMTDLTQRLRSLFPHAEGIVVQQQFVGFRPHVEEFILLVEVAEPHQPGRYVVKLAPQPASSASWMPGRVAVRTDCGTT